VLRRTDLFPILLKINRFEAESRGLLRNRGRCGNVGKEYLENRFRGECNVFEGKNNRLLLRAGAQLFALVQEMPRH
jgi:hypothetical protein